MLSLLVAIYEATLTRLVWLLRRLDIEPVTFVALLRAYALMDFRSQHYGRATATGPKALITPLFWVVGQYLLLGGVVAVVLFARVDALFFSLVCLGTSMFVVATAVIVELNEVVLDPGELNIIGHQPVPTRTYTAARVANLLGYVLLMTAALNLFPAIVGLGLRDTSWAFLPAYCLASLVGNLLVVGAVILLYTLLFRARIGDSAREAFAWTQIILIMVAVYGGQAIFRDPQSRMEMLAYHMPDWAMYLPPAWLAWFVDGFHPAAATHWWVLGVGLITVAALWWAVMWRLGVEYTRMQPGGSAWGRAVMPPLPAPGSLIRPLHRRVVGDGSEAASFWLCSTMLWRDYDLRMRSYPSFGVVVGLACLGVFSGQLGDPLVESGRASVLSIVCLYLLTFPVPTVFFNLNFSRDHEAAWILKSAPVEDRVAFAEGMRKALVYQVLLPMLLSLTLLFAILWRAPLHALIHLLIGWVLILAGSHAAQIAIVRSLPFSMPLARGGTLGSISLFSGVLSGCVLILATVHYFVADKPGAFAVYSVALVVAAAALRWTARRVLERSFAIGISP